MRRHYSAQCGRSFSNHPVLWMEGEQCRLACETGGDLLHSSTSLGGSLSPHKQLRLDTGCAPLEWGLSYLESCPCERATSPECIGEAGRSPSSRCETLRLLAQQPVCEHESASGIGACPEKAFCGTHRRTAGLAVQAGVMGEVRALAAQTEDGRKGFDRCGATSSSPARGSDAEHSAETSCDTRRVGGRMALRTVRERDACSSRVIAPRADASLESKALSNVGTGNHDFPA